jgi:hypothetical protein
MNTDAQRRMNVPSLAARSASWALLALAGGVGVAHGQPCGGAWDAGFAAATMQVSPQAAVMFDSGTGLTPHIATGARVLRLQDNRWVQVGGNFLGNLTGPTTGAGGVLWALAVFNDGSGEKLYAAGTFQRAPGGAVIRNIARWNNATQAWEGFGPGTTTGGSPTRGIINYGLPTQPGAHAVYALTVHDPDGPGPQAPALYAGGRFSGAASTPAAYVVRWTGTAWEGLAGGVNDTVYALLSHDPDGAGAQTPSLILGGAFADWVARWDGTFMNTMGNPQGEQVRALASLDADGDGPGEAVVVAGLQVGAGVAVHDPLSDAWSALGGGVAGVGLRLHRVASSTGDSLLVGGNFPTAGTSQVPVASVARWSAAGGWSSFGDGLYTQCSMIGTGMGAASPVAFLNGDLDGAGPQGERLMTFGSWQLAGSGRAMQNAAVHNSALDVWEPLAVGRGGTSTITSMHVWDEDGAGPNPPAMFASYYGTLGEQQGKNIARWNPVRRNWDPYGTCATTIEGKPLTSAHDGTTERLFVISGLAGDPPVTTLGVVRAGNVETFPGPGGVPVSPMSFCGADFDGPGGQFKNLFITIKPTETTAQVLRWNGATWSTVPGVFNAGSFNPAAGPQVELSVVRTGAGDTLYAHGQFDTIDSATFNNVARYDPATGTWQPMGNGVPGALLNGGVAQATLNGQTRVHFGGRRNFSFSTALVAGWDGSAWSDTIAEGRLTSLLNGTTPQPANVLSMAAFDDGAGPGLFVVGTFNTADGAPTSARIVKWDGAAFTGYGSGLLNTGLAAHAQVFDDGLGEALWIGNSSSVAPVSNNIAVLRRVECACGPSDVAGPGQVAGADGELTADDIIVFIGWFFASDTRADVAGAGQTVGADGQFTADDIILFINRFFAGC